MKPDKLRNLNRLNKSEQTVEVINSLTRRFTNIKSGKKSDLDYYAMSEDLINTITNKLPDEEDKENKSILVVDDISLQVVNKLWEEGYRDITLCLTRIPDELFETIKDLLKRTFKRGINIIKLSELAGE